MAVNFSSSSVFALVCFGGGLGHLCFLEELQHREVISALGIFQGDLVGWDRVGSIYCSSLLYGVL